MAKRTSGWGSLIPPKRQRKPKNPLTTLHDDILVHISSLVAASNYHNVSFILQRVCKSFNRFGNEPYVLRAMSDSVVRRLNWSRDPSMQATFQRYLDSDNLEAMYYQGIFYYFIRNDRSSEIRYLKASANAGHEKATYAYGMILFCLGGTDKAKGFDILRSLMTETISHSMRVMGIHKMDMGTSIWVHGNKGIGELRSSYVRERCGYNGKTTAFMEMDLWEREHIELEIITSEACHICFLDHEVQL